MKQDPGAPGSRERQEEKRHRQIRAGGMQEPWHRALLGHCPLGRAFPSHAEEKESKERIFWLTEGVVEGLTPPLCATAAPSTGRGNWS